MGSSGVGGSLSAASDVSLNSPVNGESLKRSGGYWVNEALTKSDIGLGDVDNTSDASKPVSVAQAAAIAAKTTAWTDIDNKPPVIAAGTTAASARSLIQAAPATGIGLDATADSASRLAMTPAERTKLSNLSGTVYVTTTGAALPPGLADGTLIARYSASGPATPVVTNAGSAILTAGSTAIAIIITSDIQVGDVMAVAVNRGTGTTGQIMGSATVSISAGSVSGWTRASASRAITHDTALLVAQVTSTIPSGSTITVTTPTNGTNRAVAIVAAISNVSSGTPDATSGDDAAGKDRDTNYGTNSSTASITVQTDAATTVTDTLVLAVFGVGASATYTQEAGQTEIGQEKTEAGSADRGVAFAYKVVHTKAVQSMTLNASSSGGVTGVALALPIKLIEV